jgi:sulfur-oxidizing protein SoxZ
VATESGTLEFNWQGDNGFAQTEKMPITVSAP